MFDIKEPINFSLLVLSVSFFLSILILYCTKPSWVLVVSGDGNESIVSWYLVLSYSATFAFVCAVGSLLFSTKERGPVSESIKRPSSMLYPSQQLASAYMG